MNMTLPDLSHKIDAIRDRMATVIAGQSEAVDELIIGLLAGGHVLLEGVPGLAKTLLARSLSEVLGLPFRRVQFTPDLMPADILGTHVYQQATGGFTLHKGPIFTQVLLADEINRTPPKTQAALLEAMQEGQVTIDGERFELPSPYLVIATQNPLDQAGTFPLPEAQLDRFLLKITVPYPDEADERLIYRRFLDGTLSLGHNAQPLEPVLTVQDVRQMQAAVRRLHIEDKVLDYVARIATATRAHRDLSAGLSPRAGMAWLAAAQAFAAIQGDDFVSPDHLKRVAQPALAHRLLTTPHAELEGRVAADVLASILDKVAQPA